MRCYRPHSLQPKAINGCSPGMYCRYERVWNAPLAEIAAKYKTREDKMIDHMRKLQKLVAAEYTSFSPYANVPSMAISRIAAKCRRD